LEVPPPDRSRIVLDDPPPPKRKRPLTQEEFDRLLAWLDPDREAAGLKYEKIRATLINRFRRLNCDEPEQRANETIDRVGQILPRYIQKYKGAREPFFYAVAYRIYMEYLDHLVPVGPLPETDLPDGATPSPQESVEADEDEAQKRVLDECLHHCLAKLDERERYLIKEYYRGDKQEKIRRRKELAEEFKVDPSYLRVMARRIRMKLKNCIRKRLGTES
jgi:DNA-directed RNA polymerase specialized sigma24 family protein